MTFRPFAIDVEGRRRQVALRREGNQWLAVLDGREIAVDVVETAGRWSMLVGPAEAGHHDSIVVSGSSRTSDVASGLSRTSDVASGLSRTSDVASGLSRTSDVASGLSRTSDVASGFSRTSYDIAFEPGSGGELVVHVNGMAVPLTIVDRRRLGRGRAGDATADAQPRTIVAPMPGRIVKVLVQPGEVVQPRQGLVVVEAMKMENELRAPRGGTVAEVRVSEGASVEANAVLVVLR